VASLEHADALTPGRCGTEPLTNSPTWRICRGSRSYSAAKLQRSCHWRLEVLGADTDSPIALEPIDSSQKANTIAMHFHGSAPMIVLTVRFPKTPRLRSIAEGLR